MSNNANPPSDMVSGDDGRALIVQALQDRALGKNAQTPKPKAWNERWGVSLLVGVGFVVITRVTSASGREFMAQYWWVFLGAVLWVTLYEGSQRFRLWRFISEQRTPLAQWQKVGLSSLYAFMASWLLYQFFLQPNKATWLEAAVLSVVAVVFWSGPLKQKYGWIGLGALMYLVFFAFSANLITGDEWNSWRLLVFAIALFIAGLFGPLAAGDPSGAVFIGCWAIAFGLWWAWRHLAGAGSASVS